MGFERLDGAGQRSELLGPCAGQTSRVDNEGCDVVQVRMRDEIGVDERAGDVASVSGRGQKGKLQALEGPRGECVGR